MASGSDVARTEVIELLGWRVLRLTNAQVLRSLHEVLATTYAKATLVRGS